MKNFRILSFFFLLLVFFSCSSITFLKSYPEKKPDWVEKRTCFEDGINYYCVSGESKNKSLDVCLENAKMQALKKIVVEKLVQVVKSSDYSKQEYEFQGSAGKTDQYELDKFETEFQQIRETADFRELSYQDYYEEWQEKKEKHWTCTSMVTIPKSEIKRIRDNQLGVKHKYENGDYYEGGWKDGKRNGKGVLITAVYRTECDWKNDKCFEGFIYALNKSFNKITLEDGKAVKMSGEFGEIAGRINIDSEPVNGDGEINYINDFNCIIGESNICKKFTGEFLCEYQNEKHLCFPDGKGTLIFHNNYDSKFEGLIKNQALLSGKLFMNGILIYEGGFKDNLRNGFGKMYYINGNVLYDGMYKENKRNGNGKWFHKNGKIYYDGEFKNDKQHGIGKYYDENGNLLYDGGFKDGTFHGKGQGIIKYQDGSRYEGNLHNNIPNGWGKQLYQNGLPKYEGEFKDGKYHGKGKQWNTNGNLIYEGGYNYHNWDGRGKWYFENGRIFYIGDFKNGKMDGNGTEYDQSGNKVYIGPYKNGKRSGSGKCLKKNLIFKDEWIDCNY